MKYRCLPVLALLLVMPACGGNNTSPTSPGAMAPATTLIAITGNVASQAGVTLAGASVTIVDGVNKGRGVTTDAVGNFQISNVTPSGGTVQAVAAGYEAKNAAFASSPVALHFVLRTAAPFSIAGLGDSVFNVPAYVTTVHVTGAYSGGSSNFIMNCGNFSGFLVNELLGTLWGPTTYSGTLLTHGCTQTTVTNSSGVTWSVTEVR